MHLAELNIGTLHYPQDDPRVAEFMNNLDLVNGLAERAPGFVWRLQGAMATPLASRLLPTLKSS